MRVRLPIKFLIGVQALLAMCGCVPAFAADDPVFPSDKEIRQKLQTAILDPSSRFKETGAPITTDETTEFRTKTLSITKSRSSSEPLILFCGTFSGPGNQPDIEDDRSNDICGVFDLKNSLAYILSDKARNDISIRPFPLSKTVDFVLLDGACGFNCRWEGMSELYEFDASSGSVKKVWGINTYSHVSADGCDSMSDYIDRGVLSEGLRGAENMREIVLSINREDVHSEPPQDIKEIKEWYGWKKGRPYLVQRTENARLVLDRAAAERLYSISQIDMSTASPARMGLIDYLADKNPMVAAAAWQAGYSHMYTMERNVGLDHIMIRELLHRFLDKNSPSRSGAENLLSRIRSFAGFSLAKEDKDLLWNAYSGGVPDASIIELLSSAGDERALKPLLDRFEAAVVQKNGCTAGEAYIHINNLAGKGVLLGDKEMSVLRNGAQANLVCDEDGHDWEVSRDIAVWLGLPPQKSPQACAPRKDLPESKQNNGDGTVTDNNTGLMWIKDTSSGGGNNGTPLNWSDAKSFCEGLNYAGYSDWRLPDQAELESIVDKTKEGPALNTIYFPDMKSRRWYWTSTDDMFGHFQATFVGFNIPGEVRVISKAAALGVRCARAKVVLPQKKTGQELDPDCEGREDVSE